MYFCNRCFVLDLLISRFLVEKSPLMFIVTYGGKLVKTSRGGIHMLLVVIHIHVDDLQIIFGLTIVFV